ncbi:MAG: SIMPL domain-containing protein [Chloroflexi bacterium]|nr:SIMPL domain-containing protein [Chloroflexota bacterium]
MNRFKGILAVAGLAAAFAVGVACSSSSETETPISQNQPGGSISSAATAPINAPAASGIVSVAPSEAVRSSAVGFSSGAPSIAGFPQLQTSNSQAGIWVTGEGTLTMEPDLAVLNIGVETTGETVAEANGDAARAMDAIVSALSDLGIEGVDVQTRSFNIFPMYEYGEVFENGRRTNKQTLVGYRVSNSVSIKIRDLDAVGEVIDEVASAGGDATRINGISFTVEDPKPFMEQLREMAVLDAIAKADQFALLTNVVRGPLVFISESGRGGSVVQNQSFDGRVAFAMAEAAPSTSISGGELELRLSVQVVFGIQ